MTDTFVGDEVQRIQAMLYAKASNGPGIRFKGLYKYLNKSEWVEAAIDRVLRNRGSRTAGIDGKTRSAYLDKGKRVELVKSITDELGTQTYSPDPVRRVFIPKPNGKKRPLGIPTIKDRVVQEMVRMLIEPIFEATFLPCSYGFRPNRCTWDALADGFMEELLFRGLFLRRLGCFVGDNWANVVTAAVFTFVHLQVVQFTASPPRGL